MNQAHMDMDDCADWAQNNPVTRRAFIPQGCDQQGRYEATIEPTPPVDRVREDYDAEDQSESADGVFWIYMSIFGAIFCAASWAVLS